MSDLSLDTWITLMRRRVLQECTVDSCIISCKATQKLLRDVLGIETRPLSVRLVAANRIWTERIAAGLAPMDDPEAWSVGIGVDDTLVKHLVLTSTAHLIDPSLDQASRPEHRMQFGPSVFPLDEPARQILLGGGRLTYTNDDTGAAVTYWHVPRDLGFTVSPNWGTRDRSRIEAMVGDVIRLGRTLGRSDWTPDAQR